MQYVDNGFLTNDRHLLCKNEKKKDQKGNQTTTTTIKRKYKHCLVGRL